MKETGKKIIPHAVALVLLLLVTFIFFAPAAFNGKVLRQGDNIQALASQTEMRHFSKETGKMPLWTNAMFSGMPGYQILFSTKNLIKYPAKLFLLGNHMAPPHTTNLLLALGMYLLLMVLGVDWRIGIIGSLGFGLATMHPILQDAGHSTKLVALGYMAPILAGVILTFRGKYLLGGGLTALFVGTQIFANHVQITYYFFLALLIFGIVYLIDAVKNHTLPDFFKAAAVLIPVVLLGVATSTGRLWTTYEYSQETIRGKSELAHKKSSSGSVAGDNGLSKNYAFDWSYGKMETFNLLIPNYYGGSSSRNFAMEKGTKTYTAIRRLKNQAAAQKAAASAGHYWGDQPFTAGPFYMGIVLIFLFFMGTFLVKGALKNWIVASVIVTIFIAWGKHFAAFNYFLFDYFPLFNKFRSVTMILGVTNLLVVIMAVLGLQELFNEDVPAAKKRKAAMSAIGITVGLLVIGLLLGLGSDFGTSGKNLPADLVTALIADRSELMKTDAFRSIFLAILAFVPVFLYLRGVLKPVIVMAIIGLLAIGDLWMVDKRFVNSDNFVSPSAVKKQGEMTAADKQILQDKALSYRVIDFSRNPFNDTYASFFHKNAGGYHAAKLMHYQELIEKYLGNPSKYEHIYGMLNTKYFIGQNGQVYTNRKALGNAWFVNSFDIVENGDAEINGLESLRPAEKALVQKKYAGYLEGLKIQKDSAATIKLVSYNPDEMVYKYTAGSEGLAVFSEIYYPPSKGWEVYLDGKKVAPFTKVDFLLRGLRLPPGKDREVKMVFHPKSYYTGDTISLITSILVLLLAIAGIVLYFKNTDLPDPNKLPATAPARVAVKQKAKVSTKSRRKKR